jgi:hypothetical protein
MKKILLCVFFIITITKINAENLFDFSWNFGNMGVGLNYSASDDDNLELSVLLFNFTLEHKELNIGLELSPVKYRHLFEFQNETETKYNNDEFSFINVNVYWDLIENNRMLLGPFVSMNYLFETSLNGINMNEYVFVAGLRFSFKFSVFQLDSYYNRYNNQIFSTEIGYRNTHGNSKLYFSVSFDIIFAIAEIGQVMAVYRHGMRQFCESL